MIRLDFDDGQCGPVINLETNGDGFIEITFAEPSMTDPDGSVGSVLSVEETEVLIVALKLLVKNAKSECESALIES